MYDHFGQMDILPTGELFLMFRRGMTHETDEGKIVVTWMMSDGQWAPPITVAVQAGMDFRDPAGGVMPSGRIAILTTPRTLSTGDWEDMQLHVSDDYGRTWSLKQTISNGLAEYKFAHGKGVQVGNKFVIPYYMSSGGVNSVRLLETTDSGETWTEGATIVSGLVNYNETGICSLGGGAVLAVSRIGSGAGGKLRQFLSLDGGGTWTDQGDITAQNTDDTNIVVAPSIALINANGLPKVICFYTNRTLGQLRYRTHTVAGVIAGNSGWSDPQNIYSAPNLSGYQSHVVIGARVLGNFFRETTPNAVAGAFQWEAYVGDIPDYESLWTAVLPSQVYTFAHGLQRPPRRVEVQFSPPASGVNPSEWYEVHPTYFNDGANKGSGAQVAISGTNVRVGTGAAVWGTAYFGGFDGTTRYTSGYYRVRAFL
ncbi:exo-alpha-sialidase [Pseudomonas sp. MS19]|nr:exo-alpha-sialidase [Pseudomonas sp. MS19]